MAKSAGVPESVPKGRALECPHCGSPRVIKDHATGRVVCSTCGRVIGEKSFDRGPEWRAFDQEGREKKSRAEPPRTEIIHDRGLSTQIDYKNRDAKGKSIPPERRAQIYRLRKWHKRAKVKDSANQNLAFSLSEMGRMSSQLGLSREIEESAAKVYREAVDKGLVRGRSMEGVASGALYIACRLAELPRTLGEVVEVSRVDLSEIRRAYRSLARELDIHLLPVDPARYVARFGDELGISGETGARAVGIIRKAQGEKLTVGRSPVSVAAASIYIAALECGERKTQVEVAEVAGVTEVTVRNRYKELERELGVSVETGAGKRYSKREETLQVKEKAGRGGAEGKRGGEEHPGEKR